MKMKSVETGEIVLSAKAQEYFDGLETGSLKQGADGTFYFMGEKIGTEEDVNTAFELWNTEKSRTNIYIDYSTFSTLSEACDYCVLSWGNGNYTGSEADRLSKKLEHIYLDSDYDNFEEFAKQPCLCEELFSEVEK